ncbi:MAG: DUF2726 domain-containing protein [Pseudomonadales bacterium]|jgi:hypothetical protein|nr:DUF2726 domain-containing protein [Pseudomonadales bacterium]
MTIMNYYFYTAVLITIVVALGVAYVLAQRSKSKERFTKDKLYEKKDFLTASEKEFLSKLKTVEKHGFIVAPQINLATVVNKIGNHRWQGELFRNIDYGIFDKNYNLLLLIELNDYSHNQPERKARDAKVKNILEQADIKLMRFYTNKPNEPDYILNRVLKAIESPIISKI